MLKITYYIIVVELSSLFLDVFISLLVFELLYFNIFEMLKKTETP